TVYSFDNMISMLPVGPAAIGTRPHGDHITGLRHLLIESPDTVSHLESHRARHDHDVSLSWGRPRRHAEPVHIVYGCAGYHKLKRSTGDAERHRKHGRKPGPIDQVIQRCHDHTTLF